MCTPFSRRRITAYHMVDASLVPWTRSHGRGGGPVGGGLGAAGSFGGVARDQGGGSQTPADLMPAPKRPRHLPRVLRADEMAALLDRIPATTPLELRDRALFELAYASGLRAEELVDLDTPSVDFDCEEVRVEGKGSKTRIVRTAEPALASVAP